MLSPARHFSLEIRHYGLWRILSLHGCGGEDGSPKSWEDSGNPEVCGSPGPCLGQLVAGEHSVRTAGWAGEAPTSVRQKQLPEGASRHLGLKRSEWRRLRDVVPSPACGDGGGAPPGQCPVKCRCARHSSREMQATRMTVTASRARTSTAGLRTGGLQSTVGQRMCVRGRGPGPTAAQHGAWWPCHREGSRLSLVAREARPAHSECWGPGAEAALGLTHLCLEIYLRPQHGGLRDMAQKMSRGLAGGPCKGQSSASQTHFCTGRPGETGEQLA